MLKCFIIFIIPLFLVSCAGTVSFPDAEISSGELICFAPPALSRAAVTGTSLPQGSSFLVWGTRTAVDGTVQTDFNGEIVTENGGVWSYTGGLRYWYAGYTYDFHAVYPHEGVNVSYTDEGNIMVLNFNSLQNVDLMTASNIDIEVMDNVFPDAVSFNFKHVLARIQFAAKSEGGNATVHSIRLSGIAVSGNYSSSNGVWDDLIDGEVTTYQDVTVGTADSKDVSGDMLLIPQELVNPSVTVTYSTETERNKRETYLLPVTAVSAWSAAKSYRYTFTITGGGHILFDVPTVNAWSHATGGNVTIDVTGPNT